MAVRGHYRVTRALSLFDKQPYKNHEPCYGRKRKNDYDRPDNRTYTNRNPGLFSCREPALDKSGLFSIIDQSHGERLAGYGVSERLRER